MSSSSRSRSPSGSDQISSTSSEASVKEMEEVHAPKEPSHIPPRVKEQAESTEEGSEPSIETEEALSSTPVEPFPNHEATEEKEETDEDYEEVEESIKEYIIESLKNLMHQSILTTLTLRRMVVLLSGKEEVLEFDSESQRMMEESSKEDSSSLNDE